MIRKMMPVVVLLCASVVSLKADVYMSEKHTTISKGKKGDETSSETATYWIAKDKLRRDTPGQSTIVRLDKDLAYIIDHKKKSYQEIPFSSITESQAPDMSELPPMIQNMMKMKVTIEPTSETKNVGEWSCTRYNQTIEIAGGKTVSEMWATEDVKVNTELFRKFHTSMFLQQPAMKQIAGNLLKEIEKVKGFVVASNSITKIMGTEVSSNSEVTEVKESDAPEGIYDLPPKYKKKKWE